jgi:hypothetical protein
MLCCTSLTSGQKTGELLGVRSEGVGGSLPTFAALVFDPTSSNQDRTSNWTASFLATTTDKEAKVQANLCDVPLLSGTCKGNSALQLTLAGPIDKSGATQLGDLNGLVGESRAEGGWTWSIAKPGVTFGLQASVARPHFDFRDSTTLSKRSTSATAHSIGVTGGWKSTTASIHAGVRLEQAFAPRDSQNVCTAAGFGPPGTTSCSSLTVGGPHSQSNRVANVDFAYSLGIAAAHANISRDFHNDVTGLDVPIYVFPNGNGGLAGGVRSGYRSDTHRWSVGVFVGEFKL